MSHPKFIKLSLKNFSAQNSAYLISAIDLLFANKDALFDDFLNLSPKNKLEKGLALIQHYAPFFWAVIEPKTGELAGVAYLYNVVGGKLPFIPVQKQDVLCPISAKNEKSDMRRQISTNQNQKTDAKRQIFIKSEKYDVKRPVYNNTYTKPVIKRQIFVNSQKPDVKCQIFTKSQKQDMKCRIFIKNSKTDVKRQVFAENPLATSEVLHSAYISLCFKRKFWGHFVSQAQKRFLRYAFGKLRFCKIFAEVYANNPLGKRFAERSGFEFVAYNPAQTVKNGEYADTLTFVRFHNSFR